ncbi:DUF6095 family protein [Spongiivirga citrea]|uniref:DUF3098 domain-containing protein n=1 Tax=Spongiivirga citrea TaxID=1481457 RepID=A0A6M0CIL8_9FLAO|nr:DUF6095 family protein [Spongiivirga citrea]NER15804.1 hypothetical protein [Spongiivirga citrea]
MNTDKELLIRGIRMMAVTAVLMFIGPTVIYQAFKNQEHFLFYPVLIAGIFFSILAIVLAFKGLNTVMNSVFGKRQK